MVENALYHGDNREVLRQRLAGESVDLVYLDPPFNTRHNYPLRPRGLGGTRGDVGETAFADAWRWDETVAAEFAAFLAAGPEKVAAALRAFRDLVGEGDLLAYLAMMAPRLVELHRVLKATGSLYLHCDPTASHYLKVLLDALFGPENFRNEIIWCYAGGGIPRRDLPRKHDVILRYTKSNDYFFAPVYRSYTRGTIQRGRTAVKGKYAEQGLCPEGTPVNDWWPDVPKITSPTDPEKRGYPTQKPEALLERIISLSSREGDLVLDPFCGSGTTLVVAGRLRRRWIGIDISPLAVRLARSRLQAVLGDAARRQPRKGAGSG